MEGIFGTESESSSACVSRTWSSSSEEEEEHQSETMELKRKKNKSKKKGKKNPVMLEGYVEADQEDLSRTKSLTDEDLDDLKGCLDLGFGFSYDEIPELCNTLPALELCYSMSQNLQSDSDSSTPIPNWRISSPGDHPEDVKARLKYWAQAVACTVRLCS